MFVYQSPETFCNTMCKHNSTNTERYKANRQVGSC